MSSAPTPPAARSAELVRLARVGALLLGARTVVLQLVVLVGNAYLTRLLSPSDFGAFAIIQFSMAFFSLLGDAGLGAALVAKKGELDDADLSSVFWLQVFLATAVIAVVFLISGYLLPLWPDLPPEGPSLLRALAFTLLLTVLRVPCSIQMERRLEFGRVAVIDVCGKIAYVVVAIVLARRGFGARALVTAVASEGVAALVAAYLLRPYRPRLIFDRARVWPIVQFGLAYQARSLLGFVNGAVTPLYGGIHLGRHVLGLNNWAQSFAYFPLEIVTILSRVSFPLLSRLRDDPPAFEAALTRSIKLVAVVACFFTALVLGIGPSMTTVIYTAKWLPALPALYVYSGAMTIGCLSPLVASALDAVGKPQLIARLAVGWVTLNWIAVPIALWRGPTLINFVVGYAIHVVVGNLAVLALLHVHFPGVRILRSIGLSILAGALTATALRFLAEPRITGPGTLVLAILAGLVVYFTIALLIDPTLIASARATLRGEMVHPPPADQA